MWLLVLDAVKYLEIIQTNLIPRREPGADLEKSSRWA